MPFRNHYVKRKIPKINPEVDLKVKILGFVVDKKENTLMVDDGSGKVSVFVDEASLLESVNINQLIRVFGSTLPTEDGFEIMVDAFFIRISNLLSFNSNSSKHAVTGPVALFPRRRFAVPLDCDVPTRVLRHGEQALMRSKIIR